MFDSVNNMRKRCRCPASRGLGRRSAKRRQGVGLSGRMRRARAGGWQVHRARFSQTLRKVGSLRFSEGAPKKGAERKAVGNGKNETSLQTRPAAFGFRTRSKHRAYCGICAARCGGGIRTRHGLRRRDGRAKRNRRHGSSRLLRRRSRHRKHGFPRAGLQTPRNLPTPTPPLETPLGQKEKNAYDSARKALAKAHSQRQADPSRGQTHLGTLRIRNDTGPRFRSKIHQDGTSSDRISRATCGRQAFEAVCASRDLRSREKGALDV